MPKLLSETIQFDGLKLQWDLATRCITLQAETDEEEFLQLVATTKAFWMMSEDKEATARVIDKLQQPAPVPTQIATTQAIKTLLGDKVPVISEADKAEAHRLAQALADAQARLEEAKAKPDPLAKWLDASGQPPKARPRWVVGRQYNYVDIVQVDNKQIDPHGECWVLKLGNGDSVLTDMEGKELEYTISDPALEPPAWMNPTGDLPATLTLQTNPPVAVSRAPIQLPQDVRDMRKVSAVLDWIRKNHPDIAATEVSTAKWIWAHREQLTCTKGLKEADVVRRVEGVFSIQ